MRQAKYTREQLFSTGPRGPYTGVHLNDISFPLGGIGAGCIGLSGRGSLRDFEIFNRPNVGSTFPRTFPVIRVQEDGKPPVARVLEGPIPRPYTPLNGGHFKGNGEGFPHMDACEFRGEYPFAWIGFQSKALPVEVTLEAYNPFIPSDADASSIPIAILKYDVRNVGNASVDVSILWSFLNLAGFTPDDCIKNVLQSSYLPAGQFMNTPVDEQGLKGILFGNMAYKEGHPLFGTLALTTPDEGATIAPCWKQGPWFSSHYHLWNHFKEHGAVQDFGSAWSGRSEAGAIAIKKRVPAGESRSFTFYISWHFPNFAKYWTGWAQDAPMEKWLSWKNHYATIYDDALDVAAGYHAKSSSHHGLTMAFHDALFSSTLPPHVLDGISANMAILKTPTCIRLTDGTFYGFEGCHPAQGCCEGSCTHVWGYQQALPFLFPALERSMHEANYKFNFLWEDIGALEFRIQLPLGSPHGSFKACADGQFGGVMHVYREWKISGNDSWLRGLWPKVKAALEFAWEEWDEEKTGVLRSFQHNTYDVDFYGPNPMLTCYYLGALKAGAEMARFMGERDRADEYMAIHEKGRAWVDAHLFDGEYYIQECDMAKAGHFQVGPGCLIDQLVGQQLAKLAGLGTFLDGNHVRSALQSIFKYNWKPCMHEHENGARLYAVNDEAATVICTWPKGGRPEIPFPYADEVMNGFEYQFAVHCIQEGMLEEGLAVVKSIRDRFDGYGRNPWNEFECGHHYARSMASYGLLVALSGFEFDKGKGHVGFTPAISPGSFSTFWSLDGAWGTYEQKGKEAKLRVLYGEVDLRSIKIGMMGGEKGIKVHHGADAFTADADGQGSIVLPRSVMVRDSTITFIKP